MFDDISIGHEIKTMLLIIERRMAPAAGEYHPTFVQGSIILYLANSDGPRYQRDVEKQFNIRRSTATGLLNTMQRDGLITRISDANDARMKQILLTDKAKSFCTALKKKADDTENDLREGLSKEEIADFLAIIKKMKANLS